MSERVEYVIVGRKDWEADVSDSLGTARDMLSWYRDFMADSGPYRLIKRTITEESIP